MTAHRNTSERGRLGSIGNEPGDARANRTIAATGTNGEREVVVIYEPHNGAAYVAADPETALDLDSGEAR